MAVRAINALTVEVKFSVPVNADSAITLANYKLGASTNPAAVTLSADGKTATLTFAASVEGTNQSFIVEPIVIKADADESTERYAGVLTYRDSVGPTVLEVEAKTGGSAATTATVYFSEPVSAFDAIKLNGVALVAGTNFTAITGSVDYLELSSISLATATEHTLEIVNLTDAAKAPLGPNVTPVSTTKFSVEVDNVAPVLESVEAKSDTALVFTFSKAVKPEANKIPTDIVKLVDSTLTDVTAAKLGTSQNSFVQVAPTSTSGYNTKWEIAISNPVLTGSSATYTLMVKKDMFVDAFTNKVAASTRTVTINKDTVKPTVTAVELVKNADGKVKEIVFTFSEDVSVANSNLNGFLANTSVNVANSVAGQLKDAFGGTIPSGSFAALGNKVTYTLGTATAYSGEYNLSVAAGAARDKSAATNANNAYAFTLNFGVAAPGASTFTVKGGADKPVAANNVITVKFSEAVKGGSSAGSATLLSAYTLNGKALPAKTEITLNPEQDIATIKLSDVDTTDAAAIFTVEGIANKLGTKTVVKYTGVVSLVDDVAPIVTAPPVHNAANRTIAYTFSEPIKLQNKSGDDVTMAANLFKVYEVDENGDYNSSSNKIGISSVVWTAATKTLTFTYDTVLAKGTYIVDAWNYNITDLAGNRILNLDFAENYLFEVN